MKKIKNILVIQKIMLPLYSESKSKVLLLIGLTLIFGIMNIQEIKEQIKKSFNDEVNLRQERIEIAEKIADCIGDFNGRTTPFKTEFGYFCGCQQYPNSNRWYAILSDKGKETKYDFTEMTMNDLTLCLFFLQREYENQCLKEYKVECEVTYNGIVTVKATNEQEAIEIAENMMNPDNLKSFPDKVKVGKIDFEYGDGSAYNAFPIKENI